MKKLLLLLTFTLHTPANWCMEGDKDYEFTEIIHKLVDITTELQIACLQESQIKSNLETISLSLQAFPDYRVSEICNGPRQVCQTVLYNQQLSNIAHQKNLDEWHAQWNNIGIAHVKKYGIANISPQEKSKIKTYFDKALAIQELRGYDISAIKAILDTQKKFLGIS